MSLLWSILEGISFVLPHIKTLLDHFINNHNPITTNNEYMNDSSYVSNSNHLVKIFTELKMVEAEELKLTKQTLLTGHFTLGVEKLKSMERKLKQQIYEEVLKPIIRGLLHNNLDELLINNGLKLTKRIKKIFPIAFIRFKENNNDLYMRISNANINPLLKSELMTFVECLHRLNPERRLHGNLHLVTGRLQSWICNSIDVPDRKMLEAGMLGIYDFCQPKSNKDWGDMIMMVPTTNTITYSKLRRFYTIDKDDLTVGTILNAKYLQDWVSSDPNFAYDVIINSIMKGKISTFRDVLSNIQEFVSTITGKQVILPDLTDMKSTHELIQACEKFNMNGIESYLNNLKLYVTAFVFITTITDNNSINEDSWLYRRLSGSSTQDPSTGVTTHGEYGHRNDSRNGYSTIRSKYPMLSG
jgi:hypothetical protein